MKVTKNTNQPTEKTPLFLGVRFMWKEHHTSHIVQLLVHACFYHSWCNHYLLVQGYQLRRTGWILASSGVHCWKHSMGTASRHCKQQLWNLHVMAKPVRFSHCSTWHMVLSEKHLALTLKVVFGNSSKADQSMKAQQWGLNSFSVPGNEMGHDH